MFFEKELFAKLTVYSFFHTFNRAEVQKKRILCVKLLNNIKDKNITIFRALIHYKFYLNFFAMES